MNIIYCSFEENLYSALPLLTWRGAAKAGQSAWLGAARLERPSCRRRPARLVQRAVGGHAVQQQATGPVGQVTGAARR